MLEDPLAREVVCPHQVDDGVLQALHAVLVRAMKGRANKVVRGQPVGLVFGSLDQVVDHVAVGVEELLAAHVQGLRRGAGRVRLRPRLQLLRHRPCLVGHRRERVRGYDQHGHQDAHRVGEVPLHPEGRVPLGPGPRNRQGVAVAHPKLEGRECEVLAHSRGQGPHRGIDDEGHQDVEREEREPPAQVEADAAHVLPRLLQRLLLAPALGAGLQRALPRGPRLDLELPAAARGGLGLAGRRPQEGQDREQRGREGELDQHADEDHAVGADAEALEGVRQGQHGAPGDHQHAPGDDHHAPALGDDRQDGLHHLLARRALLGIPSKGEEGIVEG
mmetsp:Transcript_58143/g.165277  ORF Transcript_58143/g.165277 Transcript_58143/m.165277 type:complete len:332 (-) Transcript_58143:968-1963(-)